MFYVHQHVGVQHQPEFDYVLGLVRVNNIAMFRLIHCRKLGFANPALQIPRKPKKQSLVTLKQMPGLLLPPLPGYEAAAVLLVLPVHNHPVTDVAVHTVL